MRSLRELFDPRQTRLDRDYWSKVLAGLLRDAPAEWRTFCGNLGGAGWDLQVDGMVYVHQYAERDDKTLAEHIAALDTSVLKHISDDRGMHFWRGPTFRRLQLTSYLDLVHLLGGGV